MNRYEEIVLSLLSSYVEILAKKHPNMYTFVKEHGRFYKPQELPKTLCGMPKKKCYANAAFLAELHEQYTYCEGFALADDDFLVNHAWVIDKNNNVIDATWEETGLAYMGVAFTNEYVTFVAKKRSAYGIIAETSYSYIPLKAGIPDSAYA